MAQHFVTVCVVCVLCAAHTPCSAHTDLSLPRPESFQPKYTFIQNNRELEPSYIHPKDRLHLRNFQNLQNGKSPLFKENDLHTSRKSSMSKTDSETLEEGTIHRNDVSVLESLEIMERLGQIAHIEKESSPRDEKSFTEKRKLGERSKRHVEMDEKYFTKKVFQTYGNGENMTMEGFEKLLRKIGLMKLIAELDERSTESSVGEEYF